MSRSNTVASMKQLSIGTQDNFLVKPIRQCRNVIDQELQQAPTPPSNTHNCNFVNLSSYSLNEAETLACGLSFCPNQDMDSFKVTKDIQLFTRKLILKQLYSKDVPQLPRFKSQELIALDNLVALLEENEPPDLNDQIDFEQLLGQFDQSELPNAPVQTFKKKSDKFPTLNINLNALTFVKLTCSENHKINISKDRQYNLSINE